MGKRKSAQQTKTQYDKLVRVVQDFRKQSQPAVHGGVPDYSVSAMKSQKALISPLEKRYQAINTTDWPLARQVDYVWVGAQIRGWQFEHDVLAPWKKDPAFYVPIDFQFGPKMHQSVPHHLLQAKHFSASTDSTQRDYLAQKVCAFGEILTQAKDNLSSRSACPKSDQTMLAARNAPRQLAMMDAFIESLAGAGNPFVDQAKSARKAIRDFGRWAKQKQTDPNFNHPSGIGVKHYNRYLKEVQLVPYTWEQIESLALREYNRAATTIKLLQHRHTHMGIPEFDIAQDSHAMYLKWKDTEKRRWSFINKFKMLTPEACMKPKTIKAPKQAEPFEGPTDYFSHLLRRNPLPLTLHEAIGHGPDELRDAADKRPIRGGGSAWFIDSFRAEGLATGIEELFMLAGMLEHDPRSKELTYNQLSHRAARTLSDLKMHSNEMTLKQAFKYNVDKTHEGWLQPNSSIMWHDIELYLRQPTYGCSYTVGAVQLQQLLSEYSEKMGSRFEVQTFMDRFLSLGMIPITLARWEMTGNADEIRKLLPDHPVITPH
jgi:hypothetical protein